MKTAPNIPLPLKAPQLATPLPRVHRRRRPSSTLCYRRYMAEAVLIAAMASGGSYAAGDTAGFESVDAIRDAAQHYVAANIQPGAQVSAAGLDGRLHLPACGAPLQTETASPPNSGAWTVAVRCMAPQVWSLYVPVRVSTVQSVVVAMRNLPAGQPITADAIGLQARDTSALNGGALGDPAALVGKIPRRTLAAGSTLTPDTLAAAPSVRRGQIIELLIAVGGLEVHAQGKALADGGSGELIQVENSSSRRIVQGVVRDDGRVEVSL